MQEYSDKQPAPITFVSPFSLAQITITALILWPFLSASSFFPNRNLVSDIQGKAGQLLSRGTGSAQQVGGAGGAYDNQQMIRVRFFIYFLFIFFFRKRFCNWQH